RLAERFLMPARLMRNRETTDKTRKIHLLPFDPFTPSCAGDSLMLNSNQIFCVSYVKTPTIISKLRSTFLVMKDKKSLASTLKLIKSKNPDYLIIEKPHASQMAAALLLRLAGKKFIWIQNFQNPPVPNFFSKILLAQADKIIVANLGDLNKLKSWGIKKSKIHTQR
ncbi:MAG: hypothetical protein AAB639_00720, partial [Patescibacteria group bacterium]